MIAASNHKSVVIFSAMLLWLASPQPGNASVNIKACDSLDIRDATIDILAYPMYRDHAPHPVIEIASAASASGAPHDRQNILIVGPTLGSMDSDDETSEIQCAEKGVVVVTNLTRSIFALDGLVPGHNSRWRPTLAFSLARASQPITVEARWNMRASVLRFSLDHAGLPPAAELAYPVVVTTTIGPEQ
jgi:hypothetical protein